MGVVIVVALMAALLHWGGRNFAPVTVQISEVSFANNDKQDWVEFYNPALSSLSLKGYFISDDANEPTRYRITRDLIVQSHDVVLVYGKSAKRAPAGAIRLNFNISNGETVLLTAPDGSTTVDRISVISPPDFQGPFSVGRSLYDGRSTSIFYQPSPGVPNTLAAGEVGR